MPIDLHTHSTASDGTQPPAEVIASAAAAGLDVVALTDHDTYAGWPAAFAAAHEVIRQGRRDLTLARLTPDLVYDQMVGAGCATRLVFSWLGNPGVGGLGLPCSGGERRRPRGGARSARRR